MLADRYQVRGIIGRGGMGEVYLVVDRTNGQEVALKTLHSKYGTSRHAIARFVRKVPGDRLEVSPGEPTICGALIETDDATGLARGIWPLRLGGKLAPVMPPAGP